MNSTASEVLQFVNENDVKFIRLGFCDLSGFQKNISIMAEDLPSAFENGVSFDAYAIKGFGDSTQSDLFLFPDPATITVLPWRPGPGRTARFFCDIKNPDGSPFALDSRGILKRVLDKYAKKSFACMVGVECEFYLFKTDENGEVTNTPVDKGGYLDIAPLDKSEDIRREICLTLEEMGIRPETSYHEQGPGQNEVDFKFSDALTCADNFLAFKTVVRKIAARNGLFASFMPKPISNAPGSGLHINLLFPKKMEHFISGILAKIPEITLFLNPITNSYERFSSFEVPKYTSFATDEKIKIELRSPDPSLNPYLAFALILAAGLEDIENNNNPASLPKNLTEAIALAHGSNLVKNTLGNEFLAKYVQIKETEATTFSREDYFETV